MEIQFPQRFHHGRELTLAAINHHHIRPVIEPIGLQCAAPLVA